MFGMDIFLGMENLSDESNNIFSKYCDVKARNIQHALASKDGQLGIEQLRHFEITNDMQKDFYLMMDYLKNVTLDDKLFITIIDTYNKYKRKEIAKNG